MGSGNNKFHLVASGDDNFGLDNGEYKPPIPGVEEIFHLGPEIDDPDDLPQEEQSVVVTPEESVKWPLAYGLLSAAMKRFREQEAEERAKFDRNMAEIDRRRQEAWARYEEIHNTIKGNKQ
jgi:hypothetical protein